MSFALTILALTKVVTRIRPPISVSRIDNRSGIDA